jgi:antitoxin YefM
MLYIKKGGYQMTIQATYSNARANFAKLLNTVSDDHEVVVIDRRGKESVAMISLSELDGLSETAHLLRSPKNARRLMSAIKRSKMRKTKAMTVDELKRKVGFE